MALQAAGAELVAATSAAVEEATTADVAADVTVAVVAAADEAAEDAPEDGEAEPVLLPLPDEEPELDPEPYRAGPGMEYSVKVVYGLKRMPGSVGVYKAVPRVPSGLSVPSPVISMFCSVMLVGKLHKL